MVGYYARRHRRNRRGYSKRSSSKVGRSRKDYAMARRAMRIAKSAIRRVAGEVCKFELTPDKFKNNALTNQDTPVPSYRAIPNQPLLTIRSGEPWVMPLNWYYTNAVSDGTSKTDNPWYNGIEQAIPVVGSPITVSMRQPIYYNTLPGLGDSNDNSTELQYRLKYIYINALFNASIGNSENNSDGALRVVIVKDKQPTGGSATWFDENITTNSRGVFNANRIDAQLNPSTVGRFKIMYDKTLRFNTINGYKPFKYYKALSTIVRNNRNYVAGYPILNLNSQNYAQTSDEPPPVQKNAFYIMLFSDGLNFTYSDDPSTPAASFHLFNRVAYYNN